MFVTVIMICEWKMFTVYSLKRRFRTDEYTRFECWHLTFHEWWRKKNSLHKHSPTHLQQNIWRKKKNYYYWIVFLLCFSMSDHRQKSSKSLSAVLNVPCCRILWGKRERKKKNVKSILTFAVHCLQFAHFILQKLILWNCWHQIELKRFCLCDLVEKKHEDCFPPPSWLRFVFTKL